MRCAFSGWEGQRSTPDGKTHGHKLAHARREGPVEHRDIEIILLSWDQDFGDIRLDWTRKNLRLRGATPGRHGTRPVFRVQVQRWSRKTP
jgi:hypothetical protein